MHLEINDNTSLREIEETFSNYYPYLKIEFFNKSHKKYEASPETDRIDPNTVVGDLKRTHVSGVLEIQPLYRIVDVEKEFSERFGLSIQILRKEKDQWEQTTGMDDFTLKDLNEFGRSSSDEFIVSDYEEKFEDIEEKPEKLL
jgi:glycerol-3-phosphate O-acyltransferase